jgi:hypothetical protein
MMFGHSENTQSIEIILRGIYSVGEEEQVRLKVSGDGSLEYFVDSMKAFLIAAGFAFKTVEKIGFTDDQFEE